MLPLHRGPRRPGYLVPRPLRRSAFDRVLAPDPTLVGPRLPTLAGATDAPDVLDYGLPRLLVCQHDGIAAMLLANDLHMESGAAVLGGTQVAGGLPAPLRDAMERGTTTVYLLHDATAAGAAWGAGVENRIDTSARIAALGLHPAQARALHLVRGPSGGAELTAVPPDHLSSPAGPRVGAASTPATAPRSGWCSRSNSGCGPTSTEILTRS
jgi:hypothetical protein